MRCAFKKRDFEAKAKAREKAREKAKAYALA
jgi:hypothetical protein